MIGIVGTDLCGGLGNSHLGKLRALERVSQTRIPERLFTGKESVVGKSFPRKKGRGKKTITKEHYSEAMYVLFRTRVFFDLMKPMPGAAQAMATFSDEYAIKLVCATKGLPAEWAEEWVDMYEFSVHDIVMTRGGEKTADYAKCVCAFDDELKHLTPLLKTATIPILILPPPVVRGGNLVEAPSGLNRRIQVVRGWESAPQQFMRAAA